MKLTVISHNDGQTNRLITSVHNTSFYRSSGSASNCPDTWFFFLGIVEADNNFCRRGNYSKPCSFVHWPTDVLSRVKNAFPLANRIIQHFGSIPCMLISSWLGGGLWDSKSGKSLKKFLEKKYPKFYQSATPPDFDMPDKTRFYGKEDIEMVNQWLCQRAKVKEISQLSMPKGKGEDFTLEGMVRVEDKPFDIAKLDKMLQTLPAGLRTRIEQTHPKFTQLEVLTRQRFLAPPLDIQTEPVRPLNRLNGK